MKTPITREQQTEKSYDYIASVSNKQGRLMPFELIYGDGSIHGQLSIDEVKTIYNTIADYLSNKIG